MKKSVMTFGRAMLIFIVAYVIFFFLFAAADTLFFSPGLSPGGTFTMNSLAVIFLVSILAVFVVGAVLYYIIVSI